MRSAWLLGQDAVVGEHLGEIYEKQGKNKAAAKVYELALAAVEAAPPVFRRSNFGLPSLAPDMSRRDTLTKEITARYQKLTGKKPSIRESLRLPNGEWTKTAAEQLTQLRTASLGKPAGVSGSLNSQLCIRQERLSQWTMQAEINRSSGSRKRSRPTLFKWSSRLAARPRSSAALRSVVSRPPDARRS